MFFIVWIMFFLAFLQIPRLVKNEEWRELKVFFGLWIVAFLYALLMAKGVFIPNLYERFYG